MKNLKYFWMVLCVAAGFMACSDEETGLAPVFNNSDVTLEMRRDTAEVYQISLPVTSEEGLAKITLVNTLTNETLNEVTSFSDPFNYVYNYTLDLTAYTESTVLMMALNITDLAGQTVTKRIQLTINFPVIGVRFVGENLQSQFEDYNLKVSIDKGVTDLQKVDVYLGEELAESLTLDPALESQTINVHISGLEMGENKIRLVVIDEFDQEFSTETIVTRIEQLGFADLRYISFTTGKIISDPWFGDYPEQISMQLNRPDFDYPEGYENLPYCPENPDKLYTISFYSESEDARSRIVFSLEYDENGHVSSLLKDSITYFRTNPQFEEAFLMGMNTEMGQELLWREYPTDQRGSYFRKFWDQEDLPDKGQLEKYYDVKPLHQWKGRLGQNHMVGKNGMLVFVIRGELMQSYPSASVYLSKKVGGLLKKELTPCMSSWLTDEILLVGFNNLQSDALAGYYLTFEQQPLSLQFERVKGSNSISGEFAVVTPQIYAIPLKNRS